MTYILWFGLSLGCCNHASTTAMVTQWKDQLADDEELDSQAIMLIKQRLHVPFKSILFRQCNVDDVSAVAPIVKKPREVEKKQQQWVEEQGFPYIYDGKPMQASKTQASVQHAGNMSKHTLRLNPTVVTSNKYDNIEELPVEQRQLAWSKLVGGIARYSTNTLHSLCQLFARISPSARLPKDKQQAWIRVHEAVGLAVPPVEARKKILTKRLSQELVVQEGVMVTDESVDKKIKIDHGSSLPVPVPIVDSF